MMRTLASRAVTVNDLAGEFGISRRQIYRDLAQIEEQGHPLEQSDCRSDGRAPDLGTPCVVSTSDERHAHAAATLGSFRCGLVHSLAGDR